MSVNLNSKKQFTYRQPAFNGKSRYELHNKIKQIQIEIVKLSLESKTDKRLHGFLLILLNKTRSQLAVSQNKTYQ